MDDDGADVTVRGEDGDLVCRVEGERAALSVRVDGSEGLFGEDGRDPARVTAGDVTVEDAAGAVRLRRDAFGSEEVLVAPDPATARRADGPPADRTYLPAGVEGDAEGLGEVVAVAPGGVRSVDLGTRRLERVGETDRSRDR
jgi:hypothetical protein